jgi:hypothetical protein
MWTRFDGLSTGLRLVAACFGCFFAVAAVGGAVLAQSSENTGIIQITV